MAITFKNLRSTLLAPTDQLTLGKFKGCRICDVSDQYEYLFWLQKSGFVAFNKDTMLMLETIKHDADLKEYVANEVKPWLEDFDDVPY